MNNKDAVPITYGDLRGKKLPKDLRLGIHQYKMIGALDSMKVFLSWSGDRSKRIAEVLRGWLERNIQALEIFFTPEMEKGVKWSTEIDSALEGTKFGIVCLTPENLTNSWIHFETGALSKTKDAVIWTFLYDLKPSAVPQPLGRFQHTLAEKNDILKMIHSINKRLGEVGKQPLKEHLLEEIFNENWEKFNKALTEAGTLTDGSKEGSAEKSRKESDMLNEILELIRNQQHQLDKIEEKVVSYPA